MLGLAVTEAGIGLGDDLGLGVGLVVLEWVGDGAGALLTRGVGDAPEPAVGDVPGPVVGDAPGEGLTAGVSSATVALTCRVVDRGHEPPQQIRSVWNPGSMSTGISTWRVARPIASARKP